MRFVPGWDEKCITMLAQCEGNKPVLSTYPLVFTPPDQYAELAIATYVQGLSNERAAEMYGVSTRTVGRARAAFEAALRELSLEAS